MSNISLKPITKNPHGILNLPGSKSIANRVLLLAAVANGESILHNVPDVAEDVVLMLQALTTLGIKITKLDSSSTQCSSYRILGCGGVFPNSSATIFCGNSGTSIRFLSAMLALTPGSYQLTGIERMKERPIRDLIYALRQVGADISYLEKDGFPPLQTASFKDNQAPVLKLSGQISSQYLTGMLMALPLLKRDVTVEIYDELISQPYIEITLALLRKFGCNITSQGARYTILANSNLNGVEYTIEPDASSASYFLALGAIAGDITVANLSQDSLQGDKDFAHTLALMGAQVLYKADSINVKTGKLSGIKIHMEAMPDVAMTLAVMGLFANGITEITGIASWRVKETDRLQAMYNELTKLGAQVEISNDSIHITPPDRILENIAIDTYNDHRMAMCFSLIAAYGVPITINDYHCVGKTFANYFDVFQQLCY